MGEQGIGEWGNIGEWRSIGNDIITKFIKILASDWSSHLGLSCNNHLSRFFIMVASCFARVTDKEMRDLNKKLHIKAQNKQKNFA